MMSLMPIAKAGRMTVVMDGHHTQGIFFCSGFHGMVSHKTFPGNLQRQPEDVCNVHLKVKQSSSWSLTLLVLLQGG